MAGESYRTPLYRKPSASQTEIPFTSAAFQSFLALEQERIVSIITASVPPVLPLSVADTLDNRIGKKLPMYFTPQTARTGVALTYRLPENLSFRTTRTLKLPPFLWSRAACRAIHPASCLAEEITLSYSRQSSSASAQTVDVTFITFHKVECEGLPDIFVLSLSHNT